MNAPAFRVAVTFFAAAMLTAAENLPAAAAFHTHPATRPLPAASDRPMADGPSFFVDPVQGDDRNEGTEQEPWKTLNHALRQRQGGPLAPGDTLYLRGGTYYEAVIVTVRGTAEQPITVRSYPGELAVIDAGLREFYEDPAGAWEPVPGGAAGEFRSTKSYDYGGGFGNFGDSMVPLFRYMTIEDLRSTNEFNRPGLGNRNPDPTGIYAGPGVRRDPNTGRIHVRLAHTQLAGLGERHYRGETDPRKVPLVIAGHEYALRVEGARHVRFQDLVVRGGERSAVRIAEDAEAITEDAEDLEFDGVTFYGSNAALRVSRTSRLKLIHCDLRGHKAPWHSRFHLKNRAAAGYLVYAAGRNFEFAHCELTDHHDCMQFYFTDGLRFHHNLVDNFDDDGLEPGPKKERGQALIYQNLITRCNNPFSAHGQKQPGDPPVPSEDGSGVYLYRNVIDLRQGSYKAPPSEPDPPGEFLHHHSGWLAHEHGSPTLAVYYIYHNTFLLPGKPANGFYAHTWGSHLGGTTRRVFNNIFVQAEELPGLNVRSLAEDHDFQADANLYWSVKEGPRHRGDYFEPLRQSPLFEASRKRYPPGWGSNDLFANPEFIGGAEDRLDVRLRETSPAIDAGVDLPADWPDPLRDHDDGEPDLGALPLGAEPFLIGPIAGS
jgi:hypothetical protein